MTPANRAGRNACGDRRRLSPRLPPRTSPKPDTPQRGDRDTPRRRGARSLRAAAARRPTWLRAVRGLRSIASSCQGRPCKKPRHVLSGRRAVRIRDERADRAPVPRGKERLSARACHQGQALPLHGGTDRRSATRFHERRDRHLSPASQAPARATAVRPLRAAAIGPPTLGGPIACGLRSIRSPRAATCPAGGPCL